jgi:chromosome segregation ATPase
MAIRAVPKETSERSPEREKLADAIDQFNELNSEITAIRQAIGQTETKRRGALGVVETAKEEIEKAKVSAAENMVSQALGRSSGPNVDLRKLRNEIDEAQDEIEACDAALIHLKAKLEEATYRLPHRRDDIEKALPEVVKFSPEFQRLLHDVQTASQTYVDLLNVFRNGLPPEVYNERLLLPEPDREKAALWKSAIEALKRNADAELP